jgi:hypothetical protein
VSDESDLSSQGFVKIRMADDDGFTETLWAVRVEAGENVFRLDNSPFYAYRVSAEDIIEGTPVAEGLYEFVRVVERSGNRTVRLMFGEAKADSAAGRVVLDGLRELGCSYEGMFNKFISVTVPPDVRLEEVVEYLVSTGLTWEYSDPTYTDLFGSE